MNLSELLQAGLAQIGALSDGRADSGSTTTLVDGSRDPNENAEDVVGGTLFMVTGAAAGEFGKVVGYDNFEFTLRDALSAAVVNGDRYAVSGPTFGHEELLRLGNDALRRFSIPLQDVSLQTLGNQREYVLPVGLKRHNLRVVELEMEPGRWVALHSWKVTFTPPNATAILHFAEPLLPGLTLRLTYLGAHPVLMAWDGVVSEYLHPELAKASMAERLANKLSTQAQNSAPPFNRGFDKANAELEQAMMLYPIWKPARRGSLVVVNV